MCTILDIKLVTVQHKILTEENVDKSGLGKV